MTPILLVDDDADVLDVLSEQIKEIPPNPFKAQNGLEALELLKTESVELI